MAAKLLTSEEGEILKGIGGSVRYLIEAHESGGSMGVWVQSVPGRSGPPLHLHIDADEAAFILTGEFEWEVDGESRLLKPGGFLFVPRGTVHGFKNAGNTEGSFLCWVTPGGFEGYFRERVQLDPATQKEELTALAGRFLMTVVD